MQRLKDTFYQNKEILGNVEEDGIKQPSPKFYQGEDVKLHFYLNYEGHPPDLSKHALSVILKKSPSADTVLWSATVGDGLYKDKGYQDGMYYLLMSSSMSSQFIPGLYYIDVILREKVGEGEAAKDLSQVILSTTINIALSTTSPNPKLRGSKRVTSTYDPDTGVTTVTISGTNIESTLPEEVHIDRM